MQKLSLLLAKLTRTELEENMLIFGSSGIATRQVQKEENRIQPSKCNLNIPTQLSKIKYCMKTKKEKEK